jgi:hypothetical protein
MLPIFLWLLKLFSVRFWICHVACGIGYWPTIIFNLLSPVVTICTTCYNIKHFTFCHTHCIYAFLMICTTNCDYFPKYHSLIHFYIGDAVHCEVGTVCPYWTFDEHCFQRVKTPINNITGGCFAMHLFWSYCTNDYEPWVLHPDSFIETLFILSVTIVQYILGTVCHNTKCCNQVIIVVTDAPETYY